MALPGNKKDSLSDKVADSIVREAERHYKDMRQHEVSKEDAASIVRDGFRKASVRPISRD